MSYMSYGLPIHLSESFHLHNIRYKLKIYYYPSIYSSICPSVCRNPAFFPHHARLLWPHWLRWWSSIIRSKIHRGKFLQQKFHKSWWFRISESDESTDFGVGKFLPKKGSQTISGMCWLFCGGSGPQIWTFFWGSQWNHKLHKWIFTPLKKQIQWLLDGNHDLTQVDSTVLRMPVFRAKLVVLGRVAIHWVWWMSWLFTRAECPTSPFHVSFEERRVNNNGFLTWLWS